MTDRTSYGERIDRALLIAARYGQTDGDHHKAWVIDQMVRTLLGCQYVKRQAVDYRGQPYEYLGLGESDEYREWLGAYCEGESGSDVREWREGIAP